MRHPITFGPRPRGEKVQMILRRAKTASFSKFTVGGMVKRKQDMPRPITLAKVSIPRA